ncbi:hypothetical protein AMTR_s00060p00195440 [Amborella trichopoda]|uniref:Uncharacterized protein n=1 Tax=Amborella trichopoda TaxID=13333 RepID=W1NKE1_AMBTC|nr:hypothetical protein AMTR_s00060p00195440 [Amborella trichopoda]
MVSSLWLGQSGARKYLEKDEEHISELNRKDQSSRKRSKEKREKDEENQSSIAYLKMNNTKRIRVLCFLLRLLGLSSVIEKRRVAQQLIAKNIRRRTQCPTYRG